MLLNWVGVPILPLIDPRREHLEAIPAIWKPAGPQVIVGQVVIRRRRSVLKLNIRACLVSLASIVEVDQRPRRNFP